MRECERRFREAVAEIAEHGFDHYNPATHQVVRKGAVHPADAVVLEREDVEGWARDLYAALGKYDGTAVVGFQDVEQWRRGAAFEIDGVADRLRSALASAQGTPEGNGDEA